MNEQGPHDPDRIEAIAAAIGRAFPGIRTLDPVFLARYFVERHAEAHMWFHHGEEDRSALTDVESALARLDSALARLSPWLSTIFEDSAHDHFMDQVNAGLWENRPVAPVTRAEIVEVAAVLQQAARTARARMDSGKPEGQLAWRAQAIIQVAAEGWERYHGPLPRVELSEGHPFEAFLEEVFEAFGLQRSARSQFRAWRRLQDHGGGGYWHP